MARTGFLTLSARLSAVALSLALFGGSAALAQPALPVSATPSTAPKADYSDPALWLCKPGRPDDVCGRSNQDATVLEADGSTRVERFQADPNAPIDCFYVYPTVSLDPGANATLKLEGEEVRVVNQQFARFASVCRPFAPLYRQVTLTALRAGLSGHPMPVDRELAYTDVKAAWDEYLAHDNHGRGVVLIGHSQGSVVLTQLVKREIDGKPIQKQILSVILAGYLLQVPTGKDVGGDFRSMPLCRSAGQIGCAFNFASFRANMPPPPSSRFGASNGQGLEAACTNPAALGGGDAPLKAYLASGAEAVTGDGVPQGAWTKSGKPITTPFVEVPGLLTAQCRTTAQHNFLSVTIHPTPKGERTNEITGDVIIRGKVLPDWGLHRIDMNLTMGNLIDVVRTETKTYQAQRP
jgi:hypothetical protein